MVKSSQRNILLLTKVKSNCNSVKTIKMAIETGISSLANASLPDKY